MTTTLSYNNESNDRTLWSSKSTMVFENGPDIAVIEDSGLRNRLCNLWEVNSAERDKGVQLILKIFNKIASNPTEPKYANLNFHKTRAKFDKCRPAFYLLFEAGFKQCVDGSRLQWANTTDNFTLLNKVNVALQQKIKEPHQSATKNKMNSTTEIWEETKYRRLIQQKMKKKDCAKRRLIKEKIEMQRKEHKIDDEQDRAPDIIEEKKEAQIVDSLPNIDNFQRWTVDEVKSWINAWKLKLSISQSTINNIITQVDLYQINGTTLLYLTKDDLNEIGFNTTDAKIMMQRLDYLHKHQTVNHDNTSSLKDTSTTSFTEGYLSTKEQEIYICLQQGDNYTKMAIDSSCTVFELKQKYLQKMNDNKQKEYVFLFMGQVLNDKKTLNEYQIGCNNVTIIFVAERMKSSSKKTNVNGEAAGILFINKNDNSEHILYCDTDMTFAELKNIYKDYLLKQYESKNMVTEARLLYQQTVLFECSGKKFNDKASLQECGVGQTELQYIFVSFQDITEEEKNIDDNYITKIYQMTHKEHKEVNIIKHAFEKNVKSDTFQNTIKTISKSFKTVSIHKVDQMKSYPKIQDIVKEQTSEQNKNASKYTKKIFNTPPTGKLGKDLNTTLHIIRNIFAEAGDECVFYDSRKNVKLKGGDSGCAIHEVFQKEKPFVLRLKTLDGLYGVTKDDVKDDTNKLIEMQAAIINNIEHPTLVHIKNKLSASLGFKKDRIHIIDVFSGSDCFKYTVENLTFPEKQRLVGQDPSGRLANQFQQFKELKIHPLLFRPAFDVANFDERGDKSFVSKNGRFQVGPPNDKKEYIQPTGWTRYGLSVLGKYEEDKWLHPFNNPDNWWRAFHGTKRAGTYGVDPVDAMANIHNDGFKPAIRIAYGAGVYCSPKPHVAEEYAGTVKIKIRDKNVTGQKKFKFMLQVAVKPGPDTLTSDSIDTIWSVKNKHHIRAYGILIKEIS